MRALLAIMAALILASPAQAQEIDWSGPDVTRDARVAWSLQVGVQFWGGLPPGCAAVTVTTFEDPDPDVVGRAMMPGCHIWLDRSFMNGGRVVTWLVCGVLAHELGHNWGHPHSADPWSVMYLEVRAVPNRCHRWHREHPRRKHRFAKPH